MQFYELLSFSVSQCKFVLAKIMEDITICGLCMTGLVYPFWQFSHFVDRELFIAYGWSPLCDYIICSISVQPTHLPAKVFSVFFLSKNSPCKCVGYTCMLKTNSPLALFRPVGAFGASLPPPPHLFLKISSEHFKVTVTYTSTFKWTLQPSFDGHVLQNLLF